MTTANQFHHRTTDSEALRRSAIPCRRTTLVSRTLRPSLLALLVLAAAPASAQEMPKFERMSGMLSLMQSFYGLMESVHHMAESPQKSALLQMHEIEEIYKKRGEHRKVIPVYREVLAKTKDPVIRTIAHMKLAEVLKKTREHEQAIEVLREALEESLERAASTGGG